MKLTPTAPPPEANTAPDKDGKGVVSAATCSGVMVPIEQYQELEAKYEGLKAYRKQLEIKLAEVEADRAEEVEEQVIKAIRERRAIGRNKYGTTMERDDLTKLQWVQHAQEEAMDLAIYLQRLKRDLQNIEAETRAAK